MTFPGFYYGLSTKINYMEQPETPQDPAPLDVATAIVNVVDTPFGQRPLRVHFGPDDDGAAVVDAVADRTRAELLRRIGLADILKPAVIG